MRLLKHIKWLFRTEKSVPNYILAMQDEIIELAENRIGHALRPEAILVIRQQRSGLMLEAIFREVSILPESDIESVLCSL
jgi:hypothetical protein